MKLIRTFLNTPWNSLGVLLALLTIPRKVFFDSDSFAIIFKSKNIWWMKKSVRAATVCQIVILSDGALKNDLEHELVHVEQALRTPLIHPILYQIELLRKGYAKNKYEIEAYTRSQSKYVSKK